MQTRSVKASPCCGRWFGCIGASIRSRQSAPTWHSRRLGVHIGVLLARAHMPMQLQTQVTHPEAMPHVAGSLGLGRVVALLGALLALLQRLDRRMYVLHPRLSQRLPHRVHQRRAHPRHAGVSSIRSKARSNASSLTNLFMPSACAPTASLRSAVMWAKRRCPASTPIINVPSTSRLSGALSLRSPTDRPRPSARTRQWRPKTLQRTRVGQRNRCGGHVRLTAGINNFAFEFVPVAAASPSSTEELNV